MKNITDALEAITQETLQNLKYLLENQNLQIQNLIKEHTEQTHHISKNELWEILDYILSELEEINDEVLHIRENSSEVLSKTEALEYEAKEAVDKADEISYSLRDLKSIIKGYKNTSDIDTKNQ